MEVLNLYIYVNSYHFPGRIKATEVQKHYALYNRNILGDFPGGPVVKNPSSNAGDAGSIPGQGTKIPHAEGQLS